MDHISYIIKKQSAKELHVHVHLRPTMWFQEFRPKA